LLFEGAGGIHPDFDLARFGLNFPFFQALTFLQKTLKITSRASLASVFVMRAVFF
jgi:hypothetical protein